MRSVPVSPSVLWAPPAVPLALFSLGAWGFTGCPLVQTLAVVNKLHALEAPARSGSEGQGSRTLQPTLWFSAHSFFEYAFLLGLSVGFRKMLQGVCV